MNIFGYPIIKKDDFDIVIDEDKIVFGTSEDYIIPIVNIDVEDILKLFGTREIEIPPERLEILE